jgi:hypothetical protein
MVTDPRSDLAARMAQLTLATAGARSPADILSEVTAAAVELIPGVDTAGILLIRKDGFNPSPVPPICPIISTSYR